MLNIFKASEINQAVATAANASMADTNKELSDNRGRLRNLIQSPPQDLCKIMSISPSMAAAMLERNQDEEWKNRPHSDRGLLRYSRSMKKGWALTGEAIIFSTCGRLLNGQTRLMAAIHADATFPSAVMFGIEKDNFRFMDIGIARTGGHIFAIEDIPNYNAMAAAARLLYGYYGSSQWSGGNPEPENDDLLAFYFQHSRLQDSHPFSALLHKELRIAGRWSAFTHYICAQKHRALADEYFTKIADGIGLSKKDPAYMVRRRLLSSAMSTSEKLSWPHASAFIVKGWNATRDGCGVGVLKWRTEQSPDEAFPRAI